jgi:hypothetical protein
MIRLLALVCLMLLSACADDVRFYQQASIVIDGDKECLYLGAEVQACYNTKTGEKL